MQKNDTISAFQIPTSSVMAKERAKPIDRDLSPRKSGIHLNEQLTNVERQAVWAIKGAQKDRMDKICKRGLR